MRNLFLFFSLSIFFFTFAACSEDEIPIEEPQPVFSYFRGYINDEYMEIEQGSTMDNRIHLHHITYRGDTILSCYWHITFARDFRNDEERKNAPKLHVQFAPLRQGDYYVTSNAFLKQEIIVYQMAFSKEYVWILTLLFGVPWRVRYTILKIQKTAS